MARKAAKRSPKAAPKPAVKRPKSKVATDPMGAYAKAMKGAKGDSGVQAMSLLDAQCASNVTHWVPTGSLALDRLLNGKGVPCGRITEVYGPQHIGKSTWLDHLFAQVQLQGGFGVLIDTEAGRDSSYMVRGLGVDPAKLKSLEFADPMDINIDHVLQKIIETVDFWRTEFPEVPVVLGLDSLGGMTTREELAKEVGERNVAAAAKSMRDACRKLVGRLARSKVAFVVVNHQYQSINTFGGRPAPQKTYGGDALRLHTTLRLEMFYKGLIKRGDGVVLGRQVGCRLDKNKFGWCHQVDIAVMTGHGIDNTWTLFETLCGAGHIQVEKSGWATLSLPDGAVKFQGWNGLARKCQETPELFGRLVALYEEVEHHADVHLSL